MNFTAVASAVNSLFLDIERETRCASRGARIAATIEMIRIISPALSSLLFPPEREEKKRERR